MNAREQFERDGFVVVDNLLTDEELAFFEPIVTEAVHIRSSADV